MRGGEGDVVGSVDDLLALPAQSTSALVERGTLGTCLTSLSPPPFCAVVPWVAGAAGGGSGPVLATAVLPGPPKPTNPFAVNMYRKRPRSAALVDRIEDIGLHAELGEAADPWLVSPSAEERARSDELLSRLKGHVRARNLSDSRLTSAVGLLEDFTAAFPSWILWKPMGGPDELRNAVHNELTLGKIAEFKRAQGSKQAGHLGERVMAKTIAGYISAIRTERSIGAGYKLLSAQVVNVAANALKAMRREDGPSGARDLRRGLRIQHFKTAVANGLDTTSHDGIRRMARALVAWNLLLRGGEVGTVDAREFVLGMSLLSLASVTFFSRAELAEMGRDDGAPAVRLMVVPCKDTHAKSEPPRPCWVSRRNDLDVPHMYDPTDPYDYLLEVFREESVLVPLSDHASIPLFANPDGSMVKTKDIRVDVRIMATLAGLDPSQFGASSLRIGGAEDIYDKLAEQADPIIKERGRWWTDIHRIYQRASASRHMRVSALMGSADGISLEALAPAGWALPARR
jgi:hypothetical protein